MDNAKENTSLRETERLYGDCVVCDRNPGDYIGFFLRGCMEMSEQTSLFMIFVMHNGLRPG